MSITLGIIVGAMFGAFGTAAAMASLLEARERELAQAEKLTRELAQERLDRGDLCPYCTTETKKEPT